jgi:hypothetical protein
MARNLLAIIFIVIFTGRVSAQEQSDSIPEFYLKLKEYAQKRKASFLLYQTFFNTPAKEKLNRLIEFDGEKNGLVIRQIFITTKEPFGTSLEDSTTSAFSVVQKIGNALHHRTREKAIRNFLLFTEGDLTDELKLEETERIIRNSGYIRDLKITVNQIKEDSADIKITTRDHWTFKTSGTVTSDKFTWKFTGYDLFGMGHRLSNTAVWNRKSNTPLKPYMKGFYQIPSIAGSFMTASIMYRYEGENREWGLELNRPFISVFSEWAGGAKALYKQSKDSLRLESFRFAPFSYTGLLQGLWIGRTFPLKQGQTLEEKSTKVFIAASYDIESTQSLSTNSTIAERILSSKQTSLLSMGLSNRTYSLHRYIFQFGDEEDIPSGRKMQLTGGYENNAFGGRYYGSSTLSAGGFIRSKYYCYSQMEWSTFIDHGTLQDQYARVNVFTFLPLIGGSKWKSRIFMEMGYTRLKNQSYYRPLNLAEDRLLPGYESDLPEGLERLSINLTAALFNPVDIIGFRMTPIVFVGGGWVGDGKSHLLNHTPQAVLGAGLAISNKYLAQSDFKIILAFFPNTSTDYKLGSLKAWEYSLNDFDILKPQTNF